MKKKLLIYRNCIGLGDWIMMMSLIKMLNIQFPDIEVHLNMSAKGESVPNIIKQVAEGFDARIDKFVDILKPEDEKGYDYKSGHLVYDRKLERHLIEGMVKNFYENTKINLKYDPSVLSQYQPKVIPKLLLPKEYILMPSCGGQRNFLGKEWGFERFNKLAELLSRDIAIVQTGNHSDPILKSAGYKYLGVAPWILHCLMVRSKFFIGIVNGLCHFAGHHRIRQFTIYFGREKFEWSKYENQTQLDGNKTPEEIYEIIKQEVLF